MTRTATILGGITVAAVALLAFVLQSLVGQRALPASGHAPAPLAAASATASVATSTATSTGLATSTPAAIVASPLVERYLAPAEQQRRYSAALEARDAGTWDRAAELFRLVGDGSETLQAVAQLRAAQALVRDRRPEQAVVAFESALRSSAFPKPLVVVAHQEAAEALASLGRTGEAIGHLDEALAGAGSGDRATLLWQRARLLRSAGDAGWRADALAAVQGAPGSSAASSALDALEVDGATVPTSVAAAARYRARDNEAAERLYGAMLQRAESGAEAAVASFYLGALAERRSDVAGAMEAYRRSLHLDATGPLAADARWWLGTLLEADGRPLEADEQFRAVARDFPTSRFATEAVLRSGVALATAGQRVAAAAQLRAATTLGDSAVAAGAARWLEVFGLAGTDDARPTVTTPLAFAAIASRDPGLLQPLPAAALSEWGTWPTPGASGTSGTSGASTRDGAAEARWVETTFGPRVAGPAILDDPDLAAGIALIGAGEGAVGRSLVFSALTAFRRQPHALLDLARLADGAGLPDVALEAVEAMLRPLGAAQRSEVPGVIERYAYPVAFTDEVQAAARAEGIPPLLLLALVRQESAFNPAAGSRAGAMGLTQVIQPTGEAIARSLGDRLPVNLFEPRTALRYGAHYLATQLRRFDGNVLMALAAYNGGPENAEHWRRVQRLPGADGYVHAIDFPETRLYVERVVEHYARYRQLYAGAAPTLH